MCLLTLFVSACKPTPGPIDYILPLESGEVRPGTGPVASPADARLRVLAEYLGIDGLDVTATQAPVRGTGGDSLFDVYEIPGGPMEIGTRVSNPKSDFGGFTLHERYYLCWVDENPLADLGHESKLVFVRASDGRLSILDAQLPPVVDGTEHLLFDDDRSANLVYRHEAWGRLDASDMGASQPELQQEGTFGSLGVAGAPEAWRASDLARFDELVFAATGQSARTLADTKDTRIYAAVLAAELRAASEGMGAGDQFFLFLTSHADSFGEVRIGGAWISWLELCRLLTENISAEFINVIIATPYSGRLVGTLPNWSGTLAGVRAITTTDSVSRSDIHPQAGSFGLQCIVEKLNERFELDRADGTLTPSEINAAFAGLAVTRDEVEAKVCAYIDGLISAAPQHEAVLTSFKNARVAANRNGASQSGGFPPNDLPPSPPGDALSQSIVGMTGTAATDEGAARFDVSGGTLEPAESGTSIRLAGVMQITSIVGEPGEFELTGRLSSSDDGTYAYDATGTMRALSTAQIDNLVGTITVTLQASTVSVAFDGASPPWQRVVFNLAGSM